MMMMKTAIAIATLLIAPFAIGAVYAEDGEGASTPYFQTTTFNAPIIEDWENQSTDDIAQFHLAAEQATIRTASLATGDVIAAVESELDALTGSQVSPPIYSDKVNLADGTWHVLAYDLDEATTASVMARRAGERTVVISFVERDPAARTVVLTLARTDDAQDDAGREIALALDAIGGSLPSLLKQADNVTLPSGDWVVYSSDGAAAMGMVFGNDSYVALREGAPGDLAALADAWNRTLLGFFITPDNSRYLALGLAVVFAILGTLMGSHYWRDRSLRKDLALLEQLAGEEG
ncbi:MAG: hypothetical protein OXI77_06075 [Chloroflexota bacterium]|nr:hypothetical protein [Chloroflexota bacterium]MDE2909776.1 hypothetical protein [Chloroflexota bacterium]